MDPQDLKEDPDSNSNRQSRRRTSWPAISTGTRTDTTSSDYSYDHFPADFEIKFAHAAIDNGDDFFLAQGVHTIKGVEIYKGKPIFYGVSNFVFQSGLMPQGKGIVA